MGAADELEIVAQLWAAVDEAVGDEARYACHVVTHDDDHVLLVYREDGNDALIFLREYGDNRIPFVMLDKEMARAIGQHLLNIANGTIRPM